MTRRSAFLLFYMLIISALYPIRLLSQPASSLRVMFYNVENFFDYEVDTTRGYNAFTPDGEQRWTISRYYTKRNNVFKTIAALSQGQFPALIGFCEIENEKVLDDIVKRTPLRRLNYKVVHYESRDWRGIDVAIAYRPDLLTLVNSAPLTVRDVNDTSFRTRDILYAAFETLQGELLHFYVNHWPSRYGGQIESESRRQLAASVLRSHYDSLSAVMPGAKVLMMGDFNDTPSDPSVLKVLGAVAAENKPEDNALVQLFANPANLGSEGTLKHGHDWQIFDQMIISASLYDSEQGIHYCPGSARIFHGDFLFEDDERYLGKKLFRTYSGPNYIGGFSDHLPVYVDICLPN